MTMVNFVLFLSSVCVYVIDEILQRENSRKIFVIFFYVKRQTDNKRPTISLKKFHIFFPYLIQTYLSLGQSSLFFYHSY